LGSNAGKLEFMSKVFELIEKEEIRQREVLEMIPSENYASKQVLQALGSVLTNKYSEGYPAKRYYQGNQVIDDIEIYAEDLAKKLFHVPFVNVQPYSGSPANAAIYMATLKPGQKIMGLALNHGGHISHGLEKVGFSGKFFVPAHYYLNKETGRLDYQEVEEQVLNEKPDLLICGFTAYPRIVDFADFRRIADKAGCLLLADVSHIAGLIVGGVHPDPAPFVDIIMTTTHKTLRGPRGAMIMVTERGAKLDPDLPKKINSAVFPGLQGGPHDNQTAAIAIALEEASTPEFKEYASQIVKNAKKLADELVDGGLELVSGGTDNHLILVNLQNLKLTGKEAAEKLEEAGIIVNFNLIPGDPNSPQVTSGIRLGTPALTTRGMTEPDMVKIAGWIVEVLKTQNPAAIKKEVSEFASKFPLPGIDF